MTWAFFERQSWGGGHDGPHNNFVITPMIMKFGTGIKLDVFYIATTEQMSKIHDFSGGMFCHTQLNAST